MLRRLFALLAVGIGAASWPAGAAAAPVLVLQPNGRAVAREDPFVPAGPLDPAAQGARADAGPPGGPADLGGAGAGASRAPRRKAPPERTVRSELLRLLNAHAISRAAYLRYSSQFNSALAAEHRLSGTRQRELAAVTINLHNIAASKLLTPSRLPALFLTVERNRQWWTTGPLLSAGDRVEFAGSDIVWEYYPGQGIELQQLGSFGKANAFYDRGRAWFPRLRHLLAELVPLAALRGGGLTWEYYFSFDGGRPPWTSAMSQGTALEALTRAYRAFGDRSYLAVARRALPIFHVGPPLGVTVSTGVGSRYLLYSFAPGARVLNGFLWTLVGLYDYGHASGNGDALALFASGDREARVEVPQYDTGSWSLYQPGEQASVDYHKLVTGFLWDLCRRTHARVYCATAQRFDSYLAQRGARRD